jgi:RNA polymerase primary sigma factor
MSKQQYVDPVKSLMFKTLAKAKLLTPEEEVSLSRKCRAAKVKVWEEILSDFHNVDTILSYATQRMSSLNREKLDDSKLANLRRSTVLLQRSSTKYRVHVFDKARTAAAVEVSKGDVCLQIGASMVKDLEDGVYLVPDGLAGRVSSSWKVFVKLRNEFIERNMRLVMSLAKRYRGFNIPYEDLIQEGMFGLQRAVDLFDPDRGFKFSTYSSWWVRAAIQRFCRDKGKIVRIPVHMQEAFDKYQEILQKSDDVTDRQAAEYLGISEKKVRNLKTMHKHDCFSLDAKVGRADGDGDFCLGDFMTSDDSVFDLSDTRLDMKIVQEVLWDIPSRERYIIECRFGLNGREEQTLQQIATGYSMSRERIRQLQVKAMNDLKRRIKRRAESVQAGLR